MKKKIIWSINFFILGLFSLYSLVSIFGASPAKAYAQSLSENGFHKKGQNFMVVDKEKPRGGVSARLAGEQEICMLSTEQVAELDAFFNVDTFALEVEGNTVTIASIKGRHLSKHQLLDYLQASDSELDCQVIQHHHIFFLPVLPQVS
jgi:hypothetical protein